MTSRHRTETDLRAALSDAGFTPGRRDVSPLLDLLAAGGEAAPLAEQALRRAGPAALPAALAAATNAAPPVRAAITRLVGRIALAAPEGAAAEETRTFLIARLRDEDARTRRMAAVALGKVRAPDVEEALAAAVQEERAPDVRRALVAALGKVGGRAALSVLGELAGADDVARERGRAELMVQRTLSRDEASGIAGDTAPERPVRVAARCRRGLEALLLEELSGIGAGAPALRRSACGGAWIELMLSAPLNRLFEARTMLSFAFPLKERRLSPGEDVAGAVTEVLLSADALAILRRFTLGGIRYRIAWAEGGKRRASVWRAAQAVQSRAPDLVNDPTRSTWDVIVREGEGRVLVELAPRLPDPRFAYRRGDVPAASHPTVAAALARLAGALPDDVVWDPFVGSGSELCERARLGPFRRLVGSDRDRAALEAARENLDAAGVRGAELHLRDALASPPIDEAPTLIVTNPPMGRRVHRAGDLAALLTRFVERAAAALAPGGRLVWISPFPEQTQAAAERSGLRAEVLQPIDMGGFDAQIQVLRKPRQLRRSGGDQRARPSAQRAGAGGEERRQRRDHERNDDQRDHRAAVRARPKVGDIQVRRRHRERRRRLLS
jgi:23S rRNA G2445 N2-methylase RlmL